MNYPCLILDVVFIIIGPFLQTVCINTSTEILVITNIFKSPKAL